MQGTCASFYIADYKTGKSRGCYCLGNVLSNHSELADFAKVHVGDNGTVGDGEYLGYHST